MRYFSDDVLRLLPRDGGFNTPSITAVPSLDQVLSESDGDISLWPPAAAHSDASPATGIVL
jgi:hypothetical protein